MGALFFSFFDQFFEVFRISFVRPGGLNGAVRSGLTPLYTVAIFTNETKISCIYSKNKNLVDNGNFILPDLVNMATVCSADRSDLTAPIKPPGQKKLVLKISKKSVKK